MWAGLAAASGGRGAAVAAVGCGAGAAEAGDFRGFGVRGFGFRVSGLGFRPGSKNKLGFPNMVSLW